MLSPEEKQHLIQNGTRTPAKILSIQSYGTLEGTSTFEKDDTLAWATIQIENQPPTRILIKVSKQNPPTIGTLIPVFYDPTDPSKVTTPE